MRIRSFVVVTVLTVMFAIQGFAQDLTFSPVDLRLVRASYTKITIKWQPGNSATQAVSYKVLRDNTEVGTSTATQYTDENLQTGTEYAYKIIAVSSGGENSPESAEFKVKTIKSVTFDDSNKVEQIVDQLHSTTPSSSTALVLISGVKSAFEALFSTTISFTVIDSDILNDFVNEELVLIQEVVPELTEAEQIAAQAGLDNLMTESFGGNTFEHVYIHSKLIELGEKHWQSGHKTAAVMLYEFSLKYLSDQETYVFNTLSRLGRFKLEEITETSTNTEITVILHAHRDTHIRFFDFFENSISYQAQHAHNMPAVEYFKQFSFLLAYSDYDQTVFAAAQQAAQAVIDIEDNERSQKTYEKIDAWELVNQKIVYKDSAGIPVSGTITVRNITADTDKIYYFYNKEEAFVDERQFTVTNGEVIVPSYKGHIYETTFSFNVEGGNAITFTTEGTPVAKGKVATYDNLGSPVLTDGTAGSSESVFILDRPTYPYNLSYAPAIDIFTLSWDWVNSESFTASHFKVFRGPTEIADVTTQSTANIPLDSPDGISTYTVIAYDATGNASASSKTITILPGDQTPYAAYFTWMESYFGEQLMYSCDDPDGDQINNYQEFINGTDPTKIPGPVPYLQQRTYTKITLQWDAFFTDTEGVSYKIFRNDVEVGTAITNSFTDTGLTPGLTFAYKVKAVKQDGSDTELGIPVSLTTMKPETSEYAENLQKIVDQFNPIDATEYTGASLVSAVKSGLEALVGTNITFTVIDNSILEGFVEEELTLIREISPPMTAAERLTAQTELKDMLNDSFGGNSFEHLYIHSKLTELGEKHWQAGRKAAAKALYECSLGYLKDQETYVFNTLNRLASFELDEITDTSTNVEIITALDKYRDAHLRFFDFFENSTSVQVLYAYKMPATQYFNRFPVLLKYEDYNQNVFNTALQLTQAAYAINNDPMYEKTRDKIAAWELMNLVVSVTRPDGTPAVGTLIVKNVSEKLFFNSEDNIPEEREFRIDGSTVTIPVYVGHEYDLSAAFDVVGGPAIKYTIEALPHEKGTKTIYDPYNATITQDLPEGETNGELVFISEQPHTPYNLRAATLPDVFTLSWDWVAPTADYQLQHFKVFCGGVEIGTVTQQQMDSIPRILTMDANYLYTVVAVDINNNHTTVSPALKIIPIFTEEEQVYFDWKTKYFGDTSMLANEDPDEDGLTNWEEFQLGTNPTVAPQADPKAALTNIQPGLHVRYYSKLFYTLPDFSKFTPFKEEVVEIFSFSTSSNILNSGLSKELGMVFEGYLDVPESGTYRFYLTSSDGSKLFINGVEVIDNDRYHGATEIRNSVILNKGSNAIRIEYFSRLAGTVLNLDWSGPEMERTDITPSVWYTDESNSVFAEVLAWQRDRDFDGIRDVEEKQYGTDFKNSDTDGDGIKDGDEVFKYQTDPTKKDTDGDGVSDYEEVFMSNSDALTPDMYLDTLENIQTINGVAYKSFVGSWRKVNNTYVHAQDRRGSIDYEIDLPKAYIYRLRLNVQEYYPVVREANIQLYVDGAYVGKRLVSLTRTESEDVFFYLPWLKEGKHDVKIYWDNHRSASSLKINELEVQKIEGTDTNENNIADWIESSLNKMCTVNIPATSRTSPVFIEGKNGSFLNSTNITIDGKPTATANENSWTQPWTDGTIIQWLSPNSPASKLEGLTSVSPKAEHGAGNAWYTNVPLCPNSGISTITVSMQNDGKIIAGDVTWNQTNIIQENGSTITIRRGDSLLLNASPAEADDAGQFKITCDSKEYTGEIESPQTVLFNNSGTFIINGEYTLADTPAVSGSITVKVVDYTFYDTEPACWVKHARSWDIPKYGEDVAIEFDSRFDYVEKSNVVLANDERYELTIDENKDRYVVARLGENGPILDSIRAKGFELFSSNETYVRTVEEFEDGTKIHEMLIVSSPIISDVEVKLNIFVAGVLFDDGTTQKTITASDFDATGQIRVYFIKPPEARTSVCHTLRTYQNGLYVGVRYQ